MNIELGTPYPTKLLVAVSAFAHCATIVECDGQAAQSEVESWSADCSEIGLGPPSDHGLWVWEGTLLYAPSYNGVNCDRCFDGAWRRATWEEATKFGAGIALWWKPESAEVEGL